MIGAGSLVWLAALAPASEPALFERPVNLSELNTSCRDKGPFLSCDGLTLYFHSDRRQCDGSVADIWYARRTSLTAPFGPASLLLIDGADPALSCDELTVYFIRSVIGPGGPSLDIFSATRPSTSAPFGPAQPVNELNSPFQELGPRLSHDGLSIYFASNRPGTLGDLDIWVAQRETKTSPFGIAKNVTEINSPYTETNAALSHDGLTIYFGSNRPGGLGDADIYRATRGRAEEPFGQPKNLDRLNSPNTDKAPTISGDGLTILFRSTRSGGHGYSDLYQARDAASGTVGLAQSVPQDVLYVNDSAGEDDRIVLTGAGMPVRISLAASVLGPQLPSYAIFGYFSQLPGAVFDLPFGIGALPFPASFAISPQQDRHTVTLCNGFHGNRASQLGTGLFPTPTVPGRILFFPQGFPPGFQFTVQGLIRDNGARSATGISVTNAVTVRSY